MFILGHEYLSFPVIILLTKSSPIVQYIKCLEIFHVQQEKELLSHELDVLYW